MNEDSLLCADDMNVVIGILDQYGMTLSCYIHSFPQWIINEWIEKNWKWMQYYAILVPDRLCGGYTIFGPEWFGEYGINYIPERKAKGSLVPW